MKTITIDGNEFSDLNSFYDEAQRKLCPEFAGFGKNLDALDDVLDGGFGTIEFGEPVNLVWANSEKSKRELGETFGTILEIIQEHKNIKLELQ